MPFLTIDRVTKVYPTANGPATILDGIDLDVHEGEFICLIGHSGCGAIGSRINFGDSIDRQEWHLF